MSKRNSGNNPEEKTDLRIRRTKKSIRDAFFELIDENGFDYTVTSTFGKDVFPQKTYGDVIYPKGEYTSYTINIGTGKGHNWWCVLYPPLCFVDESTGVVPDSSKEQLKKSVRGTQYKTIIKYRFKYLTFLNDLI